MCLVIYVWSTKEKGKQKSGAVTWGPQLKKLNGIKLSSEKYILYETKNHIYIGCEIKKKSIRIFEEN